MTAFIRLKIKGKVFSLVRLLKVSLISYILKKFLKPKLFTLPKTIGEYKFNSEIKKVGTSKSYLLGIYKNKTGQKALAKVWCGNVKDFDYYGLLNEIILYQVLNKIEKRTQNKKPKNLENIRIPRFIDALKNKQRLILLVEYLMAETVEALTPEEKLVVFFKASDYLRFLGENMSLKERNSISKRESIDYVLLYPLLLAKAAVTNPKAFRELCFGFFNFIKALPFLLRDGHLVLIHRDLHFRNILISGGKLSLIDLQYCVFSKQYHEVATTLRYLWGSKDNFHLLLIKFARQKWGGVKDFDILMRGAIVNSATHGLTNGYFSKNILDRFLETLKFANHEYGSVIPESGGKISFNTKEAKI